MTRNARKDCRDSCDRARPTTCTSWVCRLPLDMLKNFHKVTPIIVIRYPTQCSNRARDLLHLPTACSSRHVLASCIKGNHSDWS